MLLNKESKRETPSVISFTSKMRLMGTDAGAWGLGAQLAGACNRRNVAGCGSSFCVIVWHVCMCGTLCM